jgi:hypothetical protein
MSDLYATIKSYKQTKGQKMSLQEIVNNRLAFARNTAQEFDRMGMSDSAEMWWLVAGVLDGIILESGGES